MQTKKYPFHIYFSAKIVSPTNHIAKAKITPASRNSRDATSARALAALTESEVTIGV